LRSPDWHDGNALAIEISTDARSECLDGDLIAYPFDQHNRTAIGSGNIWCPKLVHIPILAFPTAVAVRIYHPSIIASTTSFAPAYFSIHIWSPPVTTTTGGRVEMNRAKSETHQEIRCTPHH